MQTIKSYSQVVANDRSTGQCKQPKKAINICCRIIKRYERTNALKFILTHLELAWSLSLKDSNSTK